MIESIYRYRQNRDNDGIITYFGSRDCRLSQRFGRQSMSLLLFGHRLRFLLIQKTFSSLSPNRSYRDTLYNLDNAMRFSYSGRETLFSQSLTLDWYIPRISATCFCVYPDCFLQSLKNFPYSIHLFYKIKPYPLTNMCKTHIIMLKLRFFRGNKLKNS